MQVLATGPLHTHAHTHARTHAHTHARTHTHIHCSLLFSQMRLTCHSGESWPVPWRISCSTKREILTLCQCVAVCCSVIIQLQVLFIPSGAHKPCYMGHCYVGLIHSCFSIPLISISPPSPSPLLFLPSLSLFLIPLPSLPPYLPPSFPLSSSPFLSHHIFSCSLEDTEISVEKLRDFEALDITVYRILPLVKHANSPGLTLLLR